MAERRAVAIAVAESMTAIERDEVFDILEIPTAGARRTANHRARQLRQKDPLIDELCSRVRQFSVDDLARRSRDAA
jgi:hypothetical protein